MWLQPHSTSAQLQWLCHLPPAPTLTHLHVTSSSPCSRCNFISCRAPLQYLCCGSLSARLCALTHLCFPPFSGFPPLFSPFLSLPLFNKKKKKKAGAELKQSPSSSDDLSLGKHQRKSFYCCNEMSCCFIFAVSIF